MTACGSMHFSPCEQQPALNALHAHRSPDGGGVAKRRTHLAYGRWTRHPNQAWNRSSFVDAASRHGNSNSRLDNRDESRKRHTSTAKSHHHGLKAVTLRTYAARGSATVSAISHLISQTDGSGAVLARNTFRQAVYRATSRWTRLRRVRAWRARALGGRCRTKDDRPNALPACITSRTDAVERHLHGRRIRVRLCALWAPDRKSKSRSTHTDDYTDQVHELVRHTVAAPAGGVAVLLSSSSIKLFQSITSIVDAVRVAASRLADVSLTSRTKNEEVYPAQVASRWGLDDSTP